MLSSPRWKSSGFLIRRSLVRVQQVAPVSGGLVNASGLAACSVRSHKTLRFIRSWCNGSTRDFDSCSVGSSPADRAKPTDETSMDGRRAGAAGLHHIGGSRMSNAVGPENALYSGRGRQERSAASGRHWQTLQRHGVLSFCGCGVMGAHRPSKPRTRVRSPLSAPGLMLVRVPMLPLLSSSRLLAGLLLKSGRTGRRMEQAAPVEIRRSISRRSEDGYHACLSRRRSRVRDPSALPYGSLAQSAERAAVNREVGGSSPPGIATRSVGRVRQCTGLLIRDHGKPWRGFKSSTFRHMPV